MKAINGIPIYNWHDTMPLKYNNEEEQFSSQNEAVEYAANLKNKGEEVAILQHAGSGKFSFHVYTILG